MTARRLAEAGVGRASASSSASSWGVTPKTRSCRRARKASENGSGESVGIGGERLQAVFPAADRRRARSGGGEPAADGGA